MSTLVLVPALLLTPTAAPEGLDAAVEKGIKRLEQAAENYTKNRQCFSCHHQSMPVLALARAKEKGFQVDEKVLEHQLKFTLEHFRPKLKDVRDGKNVGGANTTAAYALRTLEAVGHKPDDVTAALALFLVKRQKEDGAWPATTKRPPTEGSIFTSNALAVRTLKLYMPTGESDEEGELRKKIETAIERGKQWLEKTEAEDTEDRVFRLLGLVAANSDREKIDAAREGLLKMQLENGSWAQLPDMKGDAYATGSVLVALRTAGIATDHEAYRNGVAYLLKTQHESGGWIVETRSKPIQTFFDNGDPGGKSQFISTAATGWAVLALVEASKRKPK